MKTAEAIGVVQVGATGVVAETFRDFIARSELFKLEAISTASHTELHGKMLGQTHLECPPSLADVPIIGIMSAIDNADAPLFFSGMRTEMAVRYEKKMAEAGHLVVTNSAANRMEENVALVSAFVNPGHIDELFKKDIKDRIIAGGNCMATIIVPAIAPIHGAIGIESISAETMQGWSGAGKHRVPEGIGDSTQPIKGDEAEKIRTEPNKFLGPAINEPEDILIGAEPLRAPWLDGHRAKLTLTLSRETSRQEIEELLRGYEAPEELKLARAGLISISRAGGDKWPGRHGSIKPIKLAHGSLIRTDLKPRRLDRIQPMRIHAHIVEFDPEDPCRVIIEVSGDNLWQGAVGGNMLNAYYAHANGYIQ